MQLVLAPLSCLLDQEPDEELSPASLEQQHPKHQVGQPQSHLGSCQGAPKSAPKVHAHRGSGKVPSAHKAAGNASALLRALVAQGFLQQMGPFYGQV